jgi:hypothetical protein
MSTWSAHTRRGRILLQTARNERGLFLLTRTCSKLPGGEGGKARVVNAVFLWYGRGKRRGSAREAEAVKDFADRFGRMDGAENLHVSIAPGGIPKRRSTTLGASIPPTNSSVAFRNPLAVSLPDNSSETENCCRPNQPSRGRSAASRLTRRRERRGTSPG